MLNQAALHTFLRTGVITPEMATTVMHAGKHPTPAVRHYEEYGLAIQIFEFKLLTTFRSTLTPNRIPAAVIRSWVITQQAKLTHPLLRKGKSFNFVVAENLTREEKFKCYACNTGPEEYAFPASVLVCRNREECWRRFFALRYPSLLLVICQFQHLIKPFN